MLSTRYKKDAQLIAASTDDGTKKLAKRIYFYPPSDDSSSEDSDSETEENFFRIPMAKKFKKEINREDDTIYKCRANEHIVPYYNPEERVTMFIAGAQNCGKSYFVAEFIKAYKMMHPQRPIYLLTWLTEKDKHFEKFDIRQIIMDSTNVSELDLEKLRVDDHTGKRRGCLLIFDDIDRIRDKVLMHMVYKLLEDAYAN